MRSVRGRSRAAILWSRGSVQFLRTAADHHAKAQTGLNVAAGVGPGSNLQPGPVSVLAIIITRHRHQLTQNLTLISERGSRPCGPSFFNASVIPGIVLKDQTRSRIFPVFMWGGTFEVSCFAPE